MYLREVHAELDISTLHNFILENPLGILTTAIKSLNYPLIQSTHIPWVLDIENETDKKLGILRGHMARQNPHSKAIIESIKNESVNQLEEDVLVIFNSPIDHYITPKFYTKTKPLDGKVVPTWNYSVVEVRGKATIYFDNSKDETSDFLNKQVDDLSYFSETSIMNYKGGDRPLPWKVSDAPCNYINLMLKSIIGIEIEISALTGRIKMSQEVCKEDRIGIIEGFNNLETYIGNEMANIVKLRGDLRDEIKIKNKNIEY